MTEQHNGLLLSPCEHGVYGLCKKCNKKYGHYHSGSKRKCHCEYWKRHPSPMKFTKGMRTH